MGDTTEEKAAASGNSSNEEVLLKSEKIEEPSVDKFLTPIESCEEKLHGRVNKETSLEDKEKKDDLKEEKKDEIKEEKSTERVPPTEGEKGIEKDGLKEESNSATSKDDLYETAVNKISDSAPCCPQKEPREKIVRNQSDIFSLKDIATTLQTSIFSVNGSPSRRVFRKQEPAGHVFQRNEEPPSDKTSTPRVNRITRENYNDEKRPSSSYRNPLTGTGLSSNDEYKSKGIKRKDGNPLLGLGYDEVTSASSQHRIPPGGYSHKLW